jgi:hypothetical protein
MKRITLILFAAIMCSTANGQTKTDALSAYFNGMKVLCDSGVVVFKYERSDVNRSTDGGKTFEDVLKDAAAFQNTVSYGKLKTILLNGKTVKGLATATPDQVKPLFGDEKPKRTFAAMANDSAGIKQQVDGIKRGYDDATDFAQTFWGYFFDVFDYAKWIFYGTGAVALYFALVGKTEYTHTGKWQDRAILWIQRMSALILFIDVTVIVALYLIQAILEIKDWDLPLIIILGILYLIVQVLAWLTSWLIPNATVSNGGFGHKKGGNDEYYNSKQLQNRN